jgi:fatty-acyl-CoA synthase
LIVPLTPLDFLERARRLFGDLEGVVDGDRRFTYREFAERARRLAGALRALGVHPGDRVAYLCGNTVELLEAYYGVLIAGAVLTPLNVRLSRDELEFVLKDCGAEVLLVHPAFADVGIRAPRTIAIGEEYESLLNAADPLDADRDAIDENAVCELFYTSGSTGNPRGAMLTHRALYTHAVDSALTMGLHHRDVVLHTIPLFHVNGWGTPHYVTALGGRHVMLDRFDAGRVLELVEAEGVTRLFLVPTMGTALLTHADVATRNLSSLVQVSVGGAPPGRRLLAELEDTLGCEVISGYGLTEASPQLTKALTKRSHDERPVDEQRARRATTGLPNIGVEIRVVGDDGTEVAWDGQAPGEVLARSNHVMSGYWNLPDESASALEHGWLHTGDIAVVDGEGYITIVDRKKDIIVSGGENISSVQVENTLCEHPAVLEAAVVGMADARWGEVPRAFVVLRPGAQPVGQDDLISWVREHLAHFKAPHRIDIVTDLPKGGTGKVQKRELRERPLS